MFTKLIDTKSINLNDRDYQVKYFRHIGLKGKISYSSEVILGSKDKIILDDRNLHSLEDKVSLVFPAALYARMVTGMMEVL